ncbi:histone deacetylase [soil metagenome]
MHAPEIFYADHFVLPLPPGHRFPMQKYSMLRALVAAELPAAVLREAAAASDAELLRVHDADYVQRVLTGTLSAAETRRIGFPWSPQMVERSRRSVGATIGAARAALEHGLGVNLASGTHHAFAGSGEGLCVFNDIAVAVRAMQAEGRATRFAVLDCDVHQGNGTAAIFAGDADVFTFSVHGAGNFPFRKESSDLDVALADAAGDDDYLDAVELGIRAALESAPDLVFHLAGADPYEGDRLGRLSVTKAGLALRDDMIARACATAGVALVVVMAGGYATNVPDTVDIHFAAVRSASAHYAVRATATSTRR